MAGAKLDAASSADTNAIRPILLIYSSWQAIQFPTIDSKPAEAAIPN
jgi:hypothetical protein